MDEIMIVFMGGILIGLIAGISIMVEIRKNRIRRREGWRSVRGK